MAAHTHEYDCVICGAHLDSESASRQHTEQTHAAARVSASSTSEEPSGNEQAKHLNQGERRSME